MPEPTADLEADLESARLEFQRQMKAKWDQTGHEPVDPAPALNPDLLGYVKVFPTRELMLTGLPKGGRIMEIGTWAGTFAAEMLRVLEPRELHVVDIDLSRFEHARFGDRVGKDVFLHEGDTKQVLARFDDESFDFVYVDGDHSYSAVRHDLLQALRLAKIDGYIGVNDYTTWCACLAMPFGVMKATNEVLNEYGMPIRFMGLHHNGNHDIVIEKLRAVDIVGHQTPKLMPADNRLNPDAPQQRTIMGYPHQNVPVITAMHLRDAKLFSHRNELIASMGFLQGTNIAELGVANGDFSEFLMERLKPARFVAFDTFRLHEISVYGGVPTAVLLRGMNHLDFYRTRFADRGDRVVIESGLSHLGLSHYPDKYSGLIYIDAGHDYESVKLDAELSKRKLKDDGMLVFNDYIMFDHLAGVPYGVVPVVNELVVSEGWRVFGFALHPQMFCDIAVWR